MEENEARKRGNEAYRRVFGFDRSGKDTTFDQMTLDHLFGEVWTREGLETRDRSLVTVSVLAAMGRENELKTHLKGLRNQGFGMKEVTELMIHIAHYAGWPAGNTGMRVAKEVFGGEERPASP